LSQPTIEPLPPVAILAGGLATRLGELTARVPKCLLDIDGEPFLGHQLRLLAERGVERVVVCAGHLGAQVERAVSAFTSMERMDVRVSFDGPRPLGTAGALRRALPLLGDSFFVLYGDSYLACDYREVFASFRRSRQPALMTVHRNEDRWETSNVELRDGQIAAYDKTSPTPRMRHIDYGLGILTQRVLASIEDGASADLADVYRALVERKALAAHEVAERFYEIGSPAGLAELRALLSREPGKARLDTHRAGPGAS